MTPAEKRQQRLTLLEDHIGRSLAESEQRGELRAAPSYGKPLNEGDGYAETPAEFRMGFKILKDAGVVPPEVELMRQIEGLRQSLEGEPDEEVRRAGLQQLFTLRQQLALRLERLRITGSF
jgi:Domain of unknown function (DUF1992)